MESYVIRCSDGKIAIKIRLEKIASLLPIIEAFLINFDDYAMLYEPTLFPSLFSL